MAKTVMFSGESPWGAIINHNSLNIIERQSFLRFVLANGASKQSDLDILEKLYDKWLEEKGDLDLEA